MPVRVYDIAKKLGLENKEIIAVARELGIAAAKVSSSSLDKISAEWLEEHIIAQNPAVAAKLLIPPIVARPQSAPVEEKIVVIHAPPPVSPQPEVPKDKGEKFDDDSLAIRLKGDALVEIYSFNEVGFQHHGSFAFEVDRDSKSQTDGGKVGIPEEIILLTNNENATLEFKPSARWDHYQNRNNPDLQKGIVKAVAAFLNTEGGTLLIGVADNAKVLGLKQDFATLQKPKSDDYQMFLHSIIFDNLGHDLRPCIEISILRLNSKEVCRIAIRKSPRPVYVNDGQNQIFYARFGNSSKNLPLKAAVEYCNSRWQKS
jgi:hypothetical protein